MTPPLAAGLSPLCVVLNASLAEAAELLSGALVVSGGSLWWVAARLGPAGWLTGRG